MLASLTQSPWPSLALVLAVSTSACEQSRGPGEERRAQPRFQQVGSADGQLVDEDVACERYRSALLEAVDATSCDVQVADCPDLVRPGGNAACTRFSDESLDACEELVGDYEECSDFTRKRCILVSVLDDLTPGCVPPGPTEAGIDAGTGGDEGAGGPDAASPPMAEAGSPEGGGGGGAEAGPNGETPQTGAEAGAPPLDAAPSSEAGGPSEEAGATPNEAGAGSQPEAGAAVEGPEAGAPPVEAGASAEAGVDAAP